MRSTTRLPIAMLLLLSACSSGTAEVDAGSSDAERAPAAVDSGADTIDGEVAAGAPDERLVVPERLVVTALPGGNGVLEVVALTLREGPGGAELYAALKNAGDVPACSAALSVELFDAEQQSLAAGIGGLLTQGFYRLTDGSGSIAACVGPGDVTMAALTDLPSEVTVEDVEYVQYRCPYFALDVVSIDGLVVGEVTKVTRRDGAAYTGTLVNELDVAVKNPSVTVFPVNRVGRPLGMAVAKGEAEIAPGDGWTFETTSVDAPGVDQVAYPAGAFAD